MIKKTSIFQEDWHEMSEGERFQHARLSLTGTDNDTGLGCAVYKITPGKRAHPKHAHLANDEAIYVLAGAGTLVVGDEEVKLSEGEFALLPRGSDFAHVFVNDGSDDLVYLCLSTQNAPDIIHYPDSEKVAISERKFSGRPTTRGKVGGFYLHNTELSYWDGEDTG